jgi:hypothetical protein
VDSDRELPHVAQGATCGRSINPAALIAIDYLRPPRLPREAENSVRGAGSILDVP